MKKGFIHIYTGTGKGKTTAAVGLAARAKSRGLRVLLVQFMKGDADSGEINILKKISVKTKKFHAVISPYFNPDADRGKIKKNAVRAVSSIKRIMKAGKFDMIILDEFNCLLDEGILSDKDALAFISQKPENLELVLTGRGATRKLVRAADYVTEMKFVKHPFNKGVKPRKGIEY